MTIKLPPPWLFLAVLLLFLTACASDSTDYADQGALRVGVVTNVGKIDDKSFNQSTWEGVVRAEKELGATVRYIETVDSADFGKNIAFFADKGFEVIVTVGFPLGEATRAAAATYPHTMFIGVDQDQSAGTINNLAGLIFPEDQAGFLVGALAAMMTSSDSIGGVLATDAIPTLWRFGEGYRAGAHHINPATAVTVVYHSDVGFDKTFTDPEWGATTAEALIANGADIIFGAGGTTGNGAVIGAAQAGAYAIGVDTDQYDTLPEARHKILSSALKLIAPGVFDLIRRAREGTFPGGNHMGQVGYAPFHELDAVVPQQVREEMELIKAALLDGSLKTGVPPSKDSGQSVTAKARGDMPP
jgi:basic membrane protein A